ncbi:aldo/keto reductase [Cellulomonas sp. ACRRI]|uniref:aldo/keto reductase n=1 Tax=Cellulomonas sp. ACRRI TaxID=2918188 RepID=UPI001EF1C5E7|nr:aldo/keto reductase [Cellulomonas sp. ACRRI]MCG7286499.1 aldo/keto reductase [Cellulomonas sp. ACRRI]
MQHRSIGPYTVSAIGLGAMPMSMNNDKVYPDHDEAIATVHAALDAGVTLIDTADIYAPSWDQMGHNERIVAEAVRTWGGDTDGLLITTKGGITRSEGEQWGRDGSLAYLRSAVEKSLRELGVEAIDLYQYHRPDRWLVYGEIMEHLATLKQEGKIREIGISNASVEEIEIAQQVLGEGGLVSVQNEFSPRHPGSYDELRYCEQHGIAFLPWSPLGGTGGGGRSVGDRFSVFREIGEARGVSPQQVVLAWELALSEVLVAIPGARRPASITDSAAAADLALTAEEVERCSRAVGLEIG